MGYKPVIPAFAIERDIIIIGSRKFLSSVCSVNTLETVTQNKRVVMVTLTNWRMGQEGEVSPQGHEGVGGGRAGSCPKILRSEETSGLLDSVSRSYLSGHVSD